MSKNARMSLKNFKQLQKKKLGDDPKHGTLGVSILNDIYGKANSVKTLVRKPTGLVVDDQFQTKHFCKWERFPENPNRYSYIIDRLKSYGLYERCVLVEPRMITEEEVLLVHDKDHINTFKKITNNSDELTWKQLSSNYDSVFFDGQDTFDLAMLAAGSSLNLIKSILENDIQNGMAIIRPPGHHAMRNEFNGYCYLNNVALAAQYAITKYSVNKILIIDWDVHHGQGTQQIFYNSDQVLYISIHRYENSNYWPHLKESNFYANGKNAGEGYNINIPLNETGCTDADYLYIFHNVILPIAYEYEPQLVLISAGYDCANGDTKGEMCVSPACFAAMTLMLSNFAYGKVAAFLEGGYCYSAMAEGVSMTVGALLGDVPPPLENLKEVKSSVRRTVLNTIAVARYFWKSLEHYQVTLNPPVKEGSVVHYIKEYDEDIKKKSEDNGLCQSFKNLESRNFQCNWRKSDQVGYVYDEKMLLHKDPEVNIYEKPERLQVAQDIMKEFNLFERMKKIEVTEAEEDKILLFHSKTYLESLKDLENLSTKEMWKVKKWVTVFSSDGTFTAAKYAVGGVMKLVDMIHDKEIVSGIAIVRPPGHHAEKDTAGGFCFLNNVAVGVKYAIARGTAKKILILDWDVHHGNGTQDAFINNKQVLYLSMHRYDNGTFYPFTDASGENVIGSAPAEGYNVNIPWNNNRMSDVDYMLAFHRIVLPIAYQFEPELIVISAGFDASVGDPLGNYTVTPEAFGHFVALLKPVCAGKIILALEGGYNCNTVGYCLSMCAKALLGDPLPPLNVLTNPSDSALHTIECVINTHKKYWSFLEEPKELIMPSPR